MDSNFIIKLAAWLAVFIFACMAIFQLLLAFSAPYGNLAWGGKYKKLPINLRIGSFLSALLFIIATISLLEKATIVKIINQPIITDILVWFFVVLFGLSTFGNIVSKSKMEKRIMTPIALTLFLLCLIVGIGI